MINKKLFIFDLDGTLVDAYGAIEKSLNFSRHSLGLNPISLTKVRRNVGYGDKHFIGLFFHSKDIVKALEICRAHHKDAICKYAKLKSNARNLLYNLKRKKRRLLLLLTDLKSSRIYCLINFRLENILMLFIVVMRLAVLNLILKF